jgi:signal transduction histidine kinase/ActR/RegA family two-component response regulator
MTQYVGQFPAAEDSRVQTLLNDHHGRIVVRTDRMFGVLFLIQYVAGILAALIISPRAWSGSSSAIHPHVWTATVLGGMIISFPLYLIVKQPGKVLTRHVVAAAQMLYSALFIHLSGGRIETHFHVFGSLAFIAFYRDWRVLVTATVVVAADHILRGIYWPESVFGVATASNWRWVEHAAWVLFEDFFLIMFCVQTKREMVEIAQQRTYMELTQGRIEGMVEQRTQQLRTKQGELEVAREAAEHANRSKSNFLANMSHEIRTPMTAILGYADKLLEPNMDQSTRLNDIQIIRRNGQHLLTIINDILDISKIEAGKMTVEKIPCQPPRVIAEVVSLMGVRAWEKKLDIHVEFDGKIPQTIHSDPTRLRQVLVNLVGNAIKFTNEGSVRIVTRLVGAPDGADSQLEIDVVDTGIGLTDAQSANLFRPFTQGDTSTARRFGGTGLGLIISKRLAEMMGGDILVSSKPGMGSTFSLTIATGPLQGVTMTDQPLVLDDAEMPTEKNAAPAAPVRIDGMRVLLAEDGIDNQRLIAHVLKSRGAEVTIVENGRLAYEAAIKMSAEGKPFDVILMDIQMPEMDGYAATSKLRQKNYHGIIIALTAHAMDTDRQKCIAAGCDNYASKPVDRATLIKMLAQYFEQTRRAA